MSSRLLVLGWHNIEPTWSFPGESVGAARQGFLRQVSLLRRWARVVPLRSALSDLSQGRPLPRRAVALTFDDGYRDNATVVAPLLRATGLPATFFLVPEFLSGMARAWWEELGWAFTHAGASELSWEGERFDTSHPVSRRTSFTDVASRLKLVDSGSRLAAVTEIVARLAPVAPRYETGRQFMDWDEARELVRSGFEVGSHTCSHPILGLESPAVQRRELVESRRRLETELRCPVDLLAYPNGRPQDYTATTVQMAAEAGYQFAVTTRYGLAAPNTLPYEIRRVLLAPETDLRDLVLEWAWTVKSGARQRISTAWLAIDPRSPAGSRLGWVDRSPEH